MSEESNEHTKPTNSEEEEPNVEFYNEEFDGVSTTEERGVQVAEFGLPLNLDNISVKTKTDEFEGSVGEVTRNIAALELSGTENKPQEFEVGATFKPSQSLFAAPANESIDVDMAPPLPFFLQPARTSFRSKKTLKVLRDELETAFASLSISFSQIDNACGYNCSALRQLTVIDIEIHIFDSDSELLVEVRQVKGCRYAYGEVTDLLAETMQVSFSVQGCHLLACPPALSDEALSSMPELKRGSSCEVRCNEEVLAPTCEYALQLVADGVPRSTMLQGLRATGALVDTLASAMTSCAHCGNCGADHYHHERLFAQGGHWVRLAERVGVLALSDDEEVRTVAMAAVANIAALKHVCGTWLEGTIPTLMAGVHDDLPHVRREALRSMEAMASSDKQLAAKLVRAGAVPALELEANGGEDSQSPDNAMQSFAESALSACRSEA